MKESIDLYVAVEQMKKITNEGGCFSMKFRKADYSRKKAGEPVSVSRAALRAKPSDVKVTGSDYKLAFTDLDTGEPKTCWEMLVTEFNGMKTVLA